MITFRIFGEASKSRIKLYDDHSFGELDRLNQWDYQISIEVVSSIIVLNIDTKSNRCISVEGYIAVNNKNIKSLKIPESIRSGLNINGIINDDLTSTYKLNHRKFHFDLNQNILAYGDYNTKYPFYEFGVGQYIAIDKNGKIESLIIKFEK